MKHSHFAEMKYANRSIVNVNTNYITVFRYIKEQNKTVIYILGEEKEIYFPGDQTREILAAINGDEIPDNP